MKLKYFGGNIYQLKLQIIWSIKCLHLDIAYNTNQMHTFAIATAHFVKKKHTFRFTKLNCFPLKPRLQDDIFVKCFNVSISIFFFN